MANPFAPGNRARVKLSGLGLASGSVNPQPPLVGVVQAIDAPAADAVTVLMEDGRLLQVDNYGALDKITATASLVVNIYLDKVVNGWAVQPAANVAGVPYSDEYIGRVVDVYDLPVLGTHVLIRSLSNGMYYELPFASVFPLEDR